MTDAQRHELIYDRICPLWKMPYEQQLQEKQSAYQDLLDQLVVELKELYRDCELDEDKEQNESIADWMKQLEKIELEPIRFDEQNTGYRNKCEFSVGTDRVVGFRLNAYKQGSLKVIAPGADCPILNATSLKLRQLFEQYLAKSDLKPTDGYSQCGQWRALTVRTGSNGCMVIVHINLDDLTAERVETEKRSLKQLFEAQSEVISLYVNSSLVYGEKQIEQCMDCDRLRFQISPVSFFQINVKAAERCYAAIGELLSLNRQVFLLDVCCGTGTIGLFLADRVHKVLGVELNKQAVSDAEANAANNQIMNAEFVAGAAETQISVLIRKAEQIAKQKDTRQLQIVAVLDPPRAGLSKFFNLFLRKKHIMIN